MQRFRNRAQAGQTLALHLARFANRPDVLALALPRGGVPVAFEVAETLNLPLDVFTVRKIGVPGHEELALGAVASGGVRVLNEDVVEALRLRPAAVDALAARAEAEVVARERVYRDALPPPNVRDRTVLLVDDGLATGATMRAAIEAVRKLGAAQVIVAVPVAARETCAALREVADEVVCAITPDPFFAVGLWYEDFRQTTDNEVRALLERAQAPDHRRAA